MKDRLASLARIQRVQEHLKRQADWHLAEAERSAAEAEAERRAIEAYIESTVPTGPLVQSAIRHALKAAVRRAQAEHVAEAAKAAVIEASARGKLVERRLESLRQEVTAQEERKALERIVESLAAASAEPGEEA